MSTYIQNIIRDFSPQQLAKFVRQKAGLFRPAYEVFNAYLKKEEAFDRAEQIGLIEFSNTQTLIVAAIHVADTLTTRSSKRKQYELAKRILKAGNHNADSTRKCNFGNWSNKVSCGSILQRHPDQKEKEH